MKPKQKFPFTVEVNGPKGWEIVWEEPTSNIESYTLASRFNLAFNEMRRRIKDGAQYRMTTPDV